MLLLAPVAHESVGRWSPRTRTPGRSSERPGTCSPPSPRESSRCSASVLPLAPVEGIGRTTLIIVACALLVGAVVAIRSLIAPLLLGACVAAMVRPWATRLGGHPMRTRRGAAAATAAVVLILALPIVAVAIPVVSEGRRVVALFRSGELAGLAKSIDASFVPTNPKELAQTIGPRIADALPGLLGTASELALGVFVFLMALYYVLVDGESAMRFAKRVSPLAEQHLDALVREFVEVGRAVLVSVAVTALVEGGVAGIAYFAIGLEGAAVLTLLTAIAALVPIGTILVWGPVAAFLWSDGRPFAASVVIFTGAVVISGIDHFLRPQLARLSRARLHPLLVFVGMFGGMASLGGWGLFAGPLVLALGLAALRLWDREQRARARALAIASAPAASSIAPTPSATTSETFANSAVISRPADPVEPTEPSAEERPALTPGE
jgi:predicted PurR-regulated permease PerM